MKINGLTTALGAVLLTLWAGIIPLQAQELANYSGAFVDIGFGARPLAMGRAYSALAEDADALVWNPAGMAGKMGLAATFSHTKQFGLVPYSYAGLAYGFDSRLAAGAGVIISGDNLMRETTLMVGLATRFSVENYRIQTGLTFSLYSASFGNQNEKHLTVSGDALGYGLNLGVQFFLTPKIVLASHLRNLANAMTWNSSASGRYDQGLPREWTFGLGFRDYSGFSFDLDFRKSLYQDLDDQFFVGAEQKIVHQISLRLGTANSLNRMDPMFYTAGIGVVQDFGQRYRFALDLAYIVHPLANMLRISITLIAR